MNFWILSGSLLAFLTYFSLWKQIRSDEDEVEQNFLTWFLWGILDLIIAIALIIQGGNFLLVSVYAAGGLVSAFFIWRINGFSWTWFDLFVVFLVFVSMVIWYHSGEWMATIVSTIAMLIASIPQLVDAWKKPENMPLVAYFSYFVANVLTTAGGQDWSVKERFYPVSAGAFCFLIAVMAARKFYLESATKPDFTAEP